MYSQQIGTRCSLVVSLFFLALLPFSIACGALPVVGKTEENTETEEKILLLNNRGVAFMEQLSFERAISEFEQISDLRSDFAPAYVNLGIAHFNLQNYEGAYSHLRRALELEPGQINAHFMLGLIYRNKDSVEEAIEEFLRVAEQDPYDPSTNYYLGLLHSRKRDYERAIEFLERVIEREPYNASAHYNLAIGLIRNDRRDEGEAAMNEFRRLHGRFGTTTVGLQYLEQGSYSEVIDDLTPFLREDEDRPETPLPVTFTEVASEAGLDFTHSGPGFTSLEVADAEDLRLRVAPYLGSGIAFGDYDGDGWLDVYIANASATGARGALFRNRGDGTFEEVTLQAGIDYEGLTMTALWGDYNNNGDLDLYLVNFGPNILYRNNGDGTFTDVTSEAGVGNPSWGMGGVFVDYDHDGDLDILVVNFIDPAGSPIGGSIVPEGFQGADNVLYRNNGDGTFTEVSLESGLAGERRQTLSVVTTDFDNSRDIDFYLVNLDSPNQLFSNMRDGTFIDVASEVGLADVPAGAGVSIGDLTHNGFMDFVVPAFEGRDSRIFVNEGNARFREMEGFQEALPEGVGSILQAHSFDFDNDGDLDLLLVTAPLLQELVHPWEGRTLHLLENRGGRFIDATARTGLDAFRGLPIRGVSIGDFDNDGDLDIIANVNGGPPLLLRNDGGNRNNWFQVDTRGTNSNSMGIGTKVEIKSGRLLNRTAVAAGHGFLSQNASTAHFGLGQRDSVDLLRLLWPGGVLQSEIEQPVNRRIKLNELDRKGTSCPILYVWDGQSYRFQTDFLGGSAYGYLLAPGTYNYPDADEYIRLNPEDVALRDGHVAITMNNQLEEVIMYDKVELLVVDHPSGYQIYPDEKLLPGPPYHGFRLFSVSDARPPVSATDGRGRDILPAIGEIDRVYADVIRELPFKGYAEEYELILDLGPVSGERVILLMHAWIDYADSTGNLAASQAGLELIAPYLQVRNEEGNWVTVLDRMGFPAGLPKTMTVDLSGRFLSDSREVRIVTNMRIHWDQILVETGPASEDLRKHRIPPSSAELSFYGFPREYSPDGREPKIYDYDDVSWTADWKVHVGGYTRFGDVRSLLLAKNNQFVVTAPGDQVEVLFDVSSLHSLPEDWTRTYLVYVVGFGKDMDPNSAAPDYVGPLPYHGMAAFPVPRGTEREDLQEHLRYLEKWNTRTVDHWYPPLRRAVGRSAP